MKVIVVHTDDSISWVQSYSYAAEWRGLPNDSRIDKYIQVQLTDDETDAAEWGKNSWGSDSWNNDILKTITKGLNANHTDIKGVYSSDNEMYLRYIKIQKIKKNI